MNAKVTYLDWNATAPLSDAAKAAMIHAMGVVGNASSTHTFGRQAKQHVEKVRKYFADFVGASPNHLIFTSGGTESNALALRGSGAQIQLVSSLEHASVMNNIAHAGTEVCDIRVTSSGTIDLDHLETLLQECQGKRIQTIVMAANNETGIVQPMAEIAALTKRYGSDLHVDAVQILGKTKIDLNAPEWQGLTSMSFSGHKIGAPTGVGVLYHVNPKQLAPLYGGGGQELGIRSGTINVLGIAGLLGVLETELIQNWTRVADLRDQLEKHLEAAYPQIRIVGKETLRLPNTSLVCWRGMESQTQVIAFDLAGVCVSMGAACSSGRVATSGVLRAMGIEPALAACAVRISLGPTTTPEDIHHVTAVYHQFSQKEI